MRRNMLVLTMAAVVLLSLAGTAAAAEWANPELLLSAKDVKGKLLKW